jgi:hypothetical protein
MLSSLPLTIDLPKHILNQGENLIPNAGASSNADRSIQLNNLALYAANWYLQCLNFSTHHENRADWWVQYLSRSAVLEIAGIGKLECIPVVGDAEIVTISSDLQDDRIGYLFVKLNESLTSTEIIGFMPKYSELVRLVGAASPLENRLQSTDKLIDYLCDLAAKPMPISIIRLVDEWGQGIFNGISQAIDQLCLTPAYRSRSLLSLKSIGGGQRIKLGNLPESPIVIITVEYQQVDANNFDLYLQIRPESPATMLPIDLKFSALDEQGTNIGFIHTKMDDVSGEIVLERGQKGDRFSLELEFEHIKEIINFEV